jgi:hypothetical protein
VEGNAVGNLFPVSETLQVPVAILVIMVVIAVAMRAYSSPGEMADHADRERG